MTQARAVHPAGKPLRGTVCVPGDKSIAHRGLLLGAIAQGRLRLKNVPDGEDVRSTRRCLEALGVRFEDQAPGEVVVNGVSGEFASGEHELDCGNSGTTMRLLMGLLSGRRGSVFLTGDASLSRRPMRRVAEPLRGMGAAIELEGGEHAPMHVRGIRPLSPLRHRLQVPSAQVKSALLLAALFAYGDSAVEDPFGTRDHTERMLSWLGAALAR